MTLTKDGKCLIPYVDEVLASVNRLRNFENDLAACQDDLKVGFGKTLLSYQRPDILKEFHRHATRARLFLRSINGYNIRDELIAGTLDIGLLYNCAGGFGSSLSAYPSAPTRGRWSPRRKRKGIIRIS